LMPNTFRVNLQTAERETVSGRSVTESASIGPLKMMRTLSAAHLPIASLSEDQKDRDGGRTENAQHHA